jgi:hypothetical protein
MCWSDNDSWITLDGRFTNVRIYDASSKNIDPRGLRLFQSKTNGLTLRIEYKNKGGGFAYNMFDKMTKRIFGFKHN